jgi:glycosyltransferase involved in cell wall biosynthesis
MDPAAPDPHRAAPAEPAIGVSVVVPVFNEEQSLEPLHQRLVDVLDRTGRSFELLYVDDGSTDRSFDELARIAAKEPRARVVQLRRNFGQTAALTAGIDHARGAVLVFIDADLQNDPVDIPRLLDRLDQGFDAVSGWRERRRDPFHRRLPSRAANLLISWVTGVHLNDYGCTLKAYRAEALGHLNLYGEMHRFIPAYLAAVGARLTELAVGHAPRRHGRSKYGLGRTLKVLLDLTTVKFLGTFSTKPIYVFGGAGLGLLALSLLTGLAMVWQKYTLGVSMIQTPLLLLSAMLFLMGFQSLLMGLLSELLMRTYFESQGKRPYLVRQVLNGS